MTHRIAAAALLIGLGAGAATTAKPPAPMQTPAPMARLLDCRRIADALLRLACFDRETGVVATAIASRQLVMVDHARAQATRRELFGLSIPSFGGLFGNDDKDQITKIDSTVTGVGHNQDGGWIVTLADGSMWSQTDDTTLALQPRKGDPVAIKRAALGSFYMNIHGQLGFKAKRLR